MEESSCFPGSPWGRKCFFYLSHAHCGHWLNSGFGVELVFIKTGVRVKALSVHNGYKELKLHSIISVINEQWVYDE